MTWPDYLEQRGHQSWIFEVLSWFLWRRAEHRQLAQKSSHSPDQSELPLEQGYRVTI